jgi:uncharacterized phage protein (TIGR02218 family)
MAINPDLLAHLQTGATTTCLAWQVTRRDGRSSGFTDHDLDLEFNGTVFKANSGLTAGALQKSTGFAVDNTEVVGSLSDAAITEADIMAGRFDGAEGVTWLLNWNNVDQRTIQFRGTFGEIQVANGTFRVELRGLTDALNQSRGRVYHAGCAAVLGDGECRFDLSRPEFMIETVIKKSGQTGEYFLPAHSEFPDRWFEWGRARVLSGTAEGLLAVVRTDQIAGDFRRIEFMVDFELVPAIGDAIRLEAGCDKMAATCRIKFDNFLNFRGFPHIPSTDWIASYPVSTQKNDGGSRVR